MFTPHLKLDLSAHRRVLAVTDIHGEHAKLVEALEDIGFEERLDALIINGDLVDRGPASEAVVQWLERPGIYRCVGNHDILAQCYLDGDLSADLIAEHGGGWFLALAPERQTELARQLSRGPLALTVTTPAGRNVGFAHADCWRDWRKHIAALKDPTAALHIEAKRLNLWSRHTITDLLKAAHKAKGKPAAYTCQVSGIDHVFHGHSTVTRPFAHSNRTWFDTAACYPGGYLTVLDVDAWLDRIDEHRPFQ